MERACPILRSLALLLLLASACVPVVGQRIDIPTLAVLPSETPLPTDTPSPTFTPLPTDTPTPRPTHTPDLALSQIAGLKQTNAAAQATLDTLLTQAAPTLTPRITLTPSATAPPTAAAIPPRWVYAQGAANVRVCPTSACEVAGQLHEGEAVSATGTIEGEALVTGNALWYRVEWTGRELYVYSSLVGLAPPTLPPVDAPPTFTPRPTTVPILVSTPVPQQQPAAGCPDIHATCSQLTCAQAYACLAAGNSKLDADKDGVPCESVCK